MDKYYVTNHEHLNTGGNITVSIFTVYCREDNTTRYVTCNEEGFNWCTADTVGCAEQFDFEELEKIIIYSENWDALTSEPSFDQHLFTDEEWELFKYCQFEFYKRDCAYFKMKYSVPLNWLPCDLFNRLTDDERDWLKDTDSDILTDGANVYMPDDYVDALAARDAAWLQRVNDFKKWFDYLVHPDHSDDDMLKLYTEAIKLEFNGHTVEIPFDADTYTAISKLLDDTIKEW